MRNTKQRINGVGVAAALGAGLASALLALMPALKGVATAPAGAVTPAAATAYVLAFLAPLPIMLATFSFGTLSGLIAVIVGAAAVALADLSPELVTAADSHLGAVASGGVATLDDLISVGLPAWLLAQLALARPSAQQDDALPQGRRDERRLSQVIAFAAGFAAIAAGFNIATAAIAKGSLHAYIEANAAQLEPLVKMPERLPEGVNLHAILVVVAWIKMAGMAASNLIQLALLLWVAGRVAQISGLLAAPWPDIPSGLRVPRPLAILLAVSLGLSFSGGPLGAVGVIVSGALMMSFALQGLAVVHALTRGNFGLRLPLLIIVYSTLMVMSGLIFFWGLFGLLDTAFSFRDRQKPAVKKNH